MKEGQRSGLENRNGDREIVLTMMEIDRQTRLGSEEIKLQRMDVAIEHLGNAYKLSRHLNDDITERACAFNLGAAYITFRQPTKGLEFLQRAVPPMDKRDGISNGDLFQNFALGYEMIENQLQMVHYFEMALCEYRRENLGPDLEIAITVKVANALASIGENSRAAEFYGSLAHLYEKVGNNVGSAVSLLKRAKLLNKCGSSDHIPSLDKCLEATLLLKDVEQKSKILEDLGLAYTQNKNYDQALTCFHEELLLVEGRVGSKERAAITLQNLGAVQNSRRAYQEAIGHHERAARIFGELGKRKNQGHCFVNLAYAHARLGDMDSAGEAYLHALLGAQDSRDKKAEWQAAEGLAAVAFLRGQTDKAIQYYKQALAALSGFESEGKSQERIVAKLTDALQIKVSASVANSARSSAVSTPAGPDPARSRGEETSSLGRLAAVRQPIGIEIRTAEAPILASHVEPIRKEFRAGQTDRTTPAIGRKRMSETDPRKDDLQEDLRKRRDSDAPMVRVNDMERNISREIKMPSGSLKRRKGGQEHDNHRGHHYKFSLGIGDYESDSDRSVSSGERRRSSTASADQDQLSEQMDGMLQQYRDKQSSYRRSRPGTARNDRRDMVQGRHQSSEESTESASTSGTDESSDEDKHNQKRSSSRRIVENASMRQDQTLITVADSWESDVEWKNQAAKFLDTRSATNSGTTDSWTDPNRSPGRKRVTYRQQVESVEYSESYTQSEDDSNSELDNDHESKPAQAGGKRPISREVKRRPIGGLKLAGLDDSPSVEKTDPSLVKAPEAQKIVTSQNREEPEGELSKQERKPSFTDESSDTDSLKSLSDDVKFSVKAVVEKSSVDKETESTTAGRLSIDSDGIVTSPGQERHLKAVMKLRESFGNQTPTGSEADEHVYAEIDPIFKASTSTAHPKDPLINTYEQPSNYFEADKTMEHVTEESSESESADSLNAEEEALYATIGEPEPEPSTSQTVFKSPSKTTSRSNLEYTGPLEDAPVSPLETNDGMTMSAAEREQFLWEYQRKRDELMRRDESSPDEGSGPRSRAKKSAFCAVM